MAASPKPKRKKAENANNTLVENFLAWCKNVGLSINEKVTVREESSCHRFGMIAVDRLEEGECLFNIPRNILLEPSTSSIANILTQLNHHTETSMRHKWLPLLVTLLYEYTNSSSKWRPYLDLVPSEAVLNQPIFWNKNERDLLDLIETKDNVNSDIEQIEEQYNDYVRPFIEDNPKYFDPKLHTPELYKRLSGFVMAYSFTDSGPNKESPELAMVPMADILNHVSDHNAELEFGEDYLSMVTTQPIEKGDEVFNTYGNLDNCNLLRCHGFIEESPNPYDVVEIPMKTFQEILGFPDDVWQSKLSAIEEELPDRSDEGLVFGCNGCLCSEDELFSVLRRIHKVGDADSDEENLEEEIIVETENTKTLEECLSDVKKTLEEYKTNNDHEENHIEDQDWESESSFSGDLVDEDLQPYGELICLKVEWRATLSKAARSCSGKITGQLEKISNTPNTKLDPGRTAMIKNVLQGRLNILKRIEELYE